MPALPLAISLMATLGAVLMVVAIVAAVVSAIFFRRASPAADASGLDAAVGLERLGDRIETLVSQQQLQAETQRQALAQSLDAIGQAVGEQRHQVSGLRNELRHEVQRRDAEIEAIRSQIASIQSGQGALGGAPPRLALPPAPTAPEPPSETGREPAAAAGLPETSAPEPSAFDRSLFEAAHFDAPASEDRPDEDGAPDAAPSPGPERASLDAFEPATFEPAAFEPATFEPATFESGDGAVPYLSAAPPDSASGLGPDDALAAPRPSEPVLFESAEFDAPPLSDDSVPPAPAPFDAAEFELTGFGSFDDFDAADTAVAMFEPSAFEPSPFASPAFEPSEPAARAGAEPPLEAAPSAAPSDPWTSSESAPPIHPVSPTAEVLAPAPAPGASGAPPPAFAAFHAPPRAHAPDASGGAWVALAERAAAPAAAPAVVPEGADDLTVIGGIDAGLQQVLYRAGVTTLDEIARWSRSDARAMAAKVGVAEETIQNQWVFEAQAALYQSFAGRL